MLLPLFFFIISEVWAQRAHFSLPDDVGSGSVLDLEPSPTRWGFDSVIVSNKSAFLFNGHPINPSRAYTKEQGFNAESFTMSLRFFIPRLRDNYTEPPYTPLTQRLILALETVGFSADYDLCLASVRYRLAQEPSSSDSATSGDLDQTSSTNETSYDVLVSLHSINSFVGLRNITNTSEVYNSSLAVPEALRINHLAAVKPGEVYVLTMYHDYNNRTFGSDLYHADTRANGGLPISSEVATLTEELFPQLLLKSLLEATGLSLGQMSDGVIPPSDDDLNQTDPWQPGRFAAQALLMISLAGESVDSTVIAACENAVANYTWSPQPDLPTTGGPGKTRRNVTRFDDDLFSHRKQIPKTAGGSFVGVVVLTVGIVLAVFYLRRKRRPHPASALGSPHPPSSHVSGPDSRPFTEKGHSNPNQGSNLSETSSLLVSEPGTESLAAKWLKNRQVPVFANHPYPNPNSNDMNPSLLLQQVAAGGTLVPTFPAVARDSNPFRRSGPSTFGRNAQSPPGTAARPSLLKSITLSIQSTSTSRSQAAFSSAERLDAESCRRTAIPAHLLPTPEALEKTPCIGHGYAARVHVIRWQDRWVALKAFDFQAASVTVSLYADYFKEVEIMASLAHPNIVRFLGHGISADHRYGFLLMELAEGLSLMDHLYPRIRVIVPDPPTPTPSGFEPAHLDQCHRMNEGLQAIIRHQGFLGNFISVGTDPHPTLASSPEGQKVLREARSGSRLRPIFDEDPAEAPAITEPVLVVYAGTGVWAFNMVRGNFLDTALMALSSLPTLTFAERLRISYEVVQALHYLHREQGKASGQGASIAVVHGDIKPANVLLSLSADRTQVTAKLADIGLAKLVKVGENFGTGDRSFMSRPLAFGPHGGTAGYKDPELAGQKPKHSEKNDIWAYGVTLLELFPPTLASVYEGVPFGVKASLEAVQAWCLSEWSGRPTSAQLLESFEDIVADFEAETGARICTRSRDQAARAPRNGGRSAPCLSPEEIGLTLGQMPPRRSTLTGSSEPTAKLAYARELDDTV